jgi:hypothetical protein
MERRCTRSCPRRRRWRAQRSSRCGSPRACTGRKPRCASPCSDRFPGSAPSSWPQAWWWERSPRALSGGRDAARSPSAPWRWRSSRSRCTWRSTRRSTAAPRHTPPTWPARRLPTRPSRVGTSSAPTGWSPCSSIVTTACCGGRPSSCSRSPAFGGCGARIGTCWLARCPVCATWSSRPACARRRSAPRCSWPHSWRPPCSASGSRRGTWWPGCRSPCRSWRWVSGTRRGSASSCRP